MPHHYNDNQYYYDTDYGNYNTGYGNYDIDYGNIYQPDKPYLQSDAKTRKIYGGTWNQRREARASATDDPTMDSLASDAQAVTSIGTSVLDEVDKNPKYGAADVAKSSMKGAALGSNPALVAATGGISILAGAYYGGLYGLYQKKKHDQKQDELDAKELVDAKAKSTVAMTHADAKKFHAKQGAATTGTAYGVKDIDSFLEKYSTSQSV